MLVIGMLLNGNLVIGMPVIRILIIGMLVIGNNQHQDLVEGRVSSFKSYALAVVQSSSLRFL